MPSCKSCSSCPIFVFWCVWCVGHNHSVEPHFDLIVTAVYCIASDPVIGFFLFTMRLFVRGLSSGAITTRPPVVTVPVLISSRLPFGCRVVLLPQAEVGPTHAGRTPAE